MIIIALILALLSTEFNNVNLFISIFGTVGTIMAAFIALATTKEARNSTKINEKLMELQYEEARKKDLPTLLILDKEFEVIFESDKNMFHNLNWDHPELLLDDKRLRPNVTMNMINVGKGFAKELILEWKLINFKESIEKLMEKKSITRVSEINDVLFTGDMFNNEILRVYYANQKSAGSDDYIFKDFPIQQINYIQNNGSLVKVDIPNAYIILFNLIIMNQASIRQVEEVFPMLNLKVRYQDVNDKEFENEFIISIKNYSTGFKFGPNNRTHSANLKLGSTKINK